MYAQAQPVTAARVMASSFGYVCLIATACLIQMVLVAKEKIYYVDFERINITYWNTKYIGYLNVTAKRYGRKDPIHYVNIHGETLVAAGNNIQLDYYVYEFLSNEYRRSFVEAHFRLCDLLFHDQIFSPLLNKGLPKTCPIPKGVLHMENISLINLPFLSTFPFQKGRLFLNVTINGTAGVRERVVNGCIDAVIKQKWL